MRRSGIMALIKCPECGNEVSDSAEVCPKCGYGIKKLFEKIEQEKRKAEFLKELTRKKEEREEEERKRYDSIKMPDKPNLKLPIICFLCYSSIIILILYSLFLENGMDGFNIFCFVGNIIIFIGIPMYIFIPVYIDDIKNYKLAQTDFEAYKKVYIQNENERLQDNSNGSKKSTSVSCPYCHSHNTTKITATSKAVNTAMFGVLGQKRKYQWHCNNCKSDF